MSEWQPIETALKDGTELDVYVTALYDGRFAGRWRVQNVRWRERYRDWYSRTPLDHEPLEYQNGGSDGKSARVITHWMPIPEPPK